MKRNENDSMGVQKGSKAIANGDIVLVRAGESFADAIHEVQTNQVKKLRQDNVLTIKAREQVVKVADYIQKDMNGKKV